MGEDHQVEVLSGVSDQGYQWRVEAGGTDDNFLTMLRMTRDGQLVFGGGMAGPKLYPDTVMHESRHRKDDLPYVIVVRTAPGVDRVMVTTNLGLEIELGLSAVNVQFGLRFAAEVLPAGHAPGSVRAESQGQVLQTARQWMPPVRPRRSGGSGVIPAGTDWPNSAS